MPTVAGGTVGSPDPGEALALSEIPTGSLSPALPHAQTSAPTNPLPPLLLFAQCSADVRVQEDELSGTGNFSGRSQFSHGI